jgi:hypothetical protein
MGKSVLLQTKITIQTIVIKQLNYDSQVEKAGVMYTFFEQ